MKKLILLTLVSAFTLSMVAQDDDMYFVPTKENVAKEAKKYGMPQKTYYSGSNRSVDDYNRRAQFSNPADTTGNDIIDFSATKGVYPEESAAPVEDYQYTRQLSRFDDYTPTEAYWDGYRDGSWASPWYYNSWYSWYDRSWYWDTPWYYGGWGYYRPWGYYYTWYAPRYVGGVRTVYRSHPRFHANRGGTATGVRTFGNRQSSGFASGTFGNSSRVRTNGNTTRSGDFNRSSSSTSRSSGSFGGVRSSGSFGGSSRSSGSFGGGGGSRSGGSFGGGRSGGGGRFGR
jgi:hypothetical protein